MGRPRRRRPRVAGPRPRRVVNRVSHREWRRHADRRTSQSVLDAGGRGSRDLPPPGRGPRVPPRVAKARGPPHVAERPQRRRARVSGPAPAGPWTACPTASGEGTRTAARRRASSTPTGTGRGTCPAGPWTACPTASGEGARAAAGRRASSTAAGAGRGCGGWVKRHRSASVRVLGGMRRRGCRSVLVDSLSWIRPFRTPLVGQVLDGRYRVDARIAAGGMATVYRALDTRLDRVLALKVMHPDARGRRDVRRAVHPGGQVRRPARPPQRGAGLRPGDRRVVRVPGDGVHRRLHPAGRAARAGRGPAEGRAGHPGAGARRAGRRAPGRVRAPGHEAGERADRRRRPGQGRRLPGWCAPWTR